MTCCSFPLPWSADRLDQSASISYRALTRAIRIFSWRPGFLNTALAREVMVCRKVIFFPAIPTVSYTVEIFTFFPTIP
jgi:hypothetical protein